MENNELLQAIRVMIQEEVKPIKTDIAELKSKFSAVEQDMASATQQNENTRLMKAIQHNTEVLNAKLDGLTITTASKDAIAKLDSKFDVLNTRLFQQEAEINQLKAVK